MGNRLSTSTPTPFLPYPFPYSFSVLTLSITKLNFSSLTTNKFLSPKSICPPLILIFLSLSLNSSPNESLPSISFFVLYSFIPLLIYPSPTPYPPTNLDPPTFIFPPLSLFLLFLLLPRIPILPTTLLFSFYILLLQAPPPLVFLVLVFCPLYGYPLFSPPHFS